MFCFIFLTYVHAHKRRVKNSHPLYVALGYFHNQADALQYICDVVDSPLLSNSQSPDRLKQQGKKMLFLPQPPCLTHTHTAVIQRQCIRPTLTPQMCSSSVLSAGLLRGQLKLIICLRLTLSLHTSLHVLLLSFYTHNVNKIELLFLWGLMHLFISWSKSFCLTNEV